MARRRRNQGGYAQIDPRQAHIIGQGQPQAEPTEEQKALIEKMQKRSAVRQMSVAFAQALVHGKGGGDIDAAAVAANAYAIATAVLDHSEKLDEEDPIDLSTLQVVQG